MLRILVKKKGLQTLIQDEGRVGYQAFGVPVGGPMDRFSAKLANLLVSNPPEMPVLEITLMGPVLVFDSACQIALTGADLSPKLNGQSIGLNETLFVEKNAVLSFGRPLHGCRAYLAVAGTWEKAALLKSRDFSLKLYEKRINSDLKINNVIVINNSTHRPLKSLAPGTIAKHESSPAIRVLPGPEFEEFSRHNIADFFSQTFTLTNDSNRMGYRIYPQIQDYSPSRELISSGIVPGTIQVSNSGQPIIVMADAQTSGGYFRIANVISADMPKLAQLKPREKLRFVLVREAEAREAMIKEAQLLNSIQ